MFLQRALAEIPTRDQPYMELLGSPILWQDHHRVIMRSNDYLLGKPFGESIFG